MTHKMNGAKALMEALLNEGVETIFGYPGGATTHVFDALYDYTDRVRYVLTRHEQGATHAAQGYARVSGKPGVCIVTSGPGAANTITGIDDALMDSTPLIVITGQVSSHLLGSDAFQEIDMVGVTQPITKWSYQIRDAKEIAWAVAKAFYIAKSGRPGPVVLDFAKNAQISEVDFKPEKCNFIRSYFPIPTLRTETLQEAADLINSSKRPLALVGHGVTIGEAEEELKAFLEKADIPAAWTMLGESALPTDYRLNMGMLGMHGNVGPNMQTNQCDLLIAIGMRFDDRVTGDLANYAKQAKVIHFEIDPAEIDKNVKTDVAVLGNVKQMLPKVSAMLQKADHHEWIASFEPYKQKEWDAVISKEIAPKDGPIRMGEVVSKVSAAVNDDAILVTDVGQNQMSAIRYFRFKRKRSVVSSGGAGTMGFGIPAAIGAKIAAPDRKVCLFCGDGGFQMTVQELGTILQENKLGVKIILLNNNYLGMVRQWQELFFNKRYSSTPLVNPDFNALAAAYGIATAHVTKRDELDKGISAMLADDKAFLLVVECESQGLVYPMTPAGCKVNDIMLGE